jgi:hypothetical protein
MSLMERGEREKEGRRDEEKVEKVALHSCNVKAGAR